MLHVGPGALLSGALLSDFERLRNDWFSHGMLTRMCNDPENGSRVGCINAEETVCKGANILGEPVSK